MGRPSLAGERTEQIMAATYACLREHGLAGTTLERVSERSGLSRSHVRHYVGNRVDLLRRFADWMFTGLEKDLEAIAASEPPEERLEAMNRHLFGAGFAPETDDDAVIRELMTAGLSDETLRAQTQQRYEHAVGLVTRAVRDSRPELSARQARALAYGLWSLAIGSSTMAEVGLKDAQGSTPRKLADALVDAMTP